MRFGIVFNFGKDLTAIAPGQRLDPCGRVGKTVTDSEQLGKLVGVSSTSKKEAATNLQNKRKHQHRKYSTYQPHNSKQVPKIEYQPK